MGKEKPEKSAAPEKAGKGNVDIDFKSLRVLFDAFQPWKPLPAGHAFYVDCSVERGSEDLLGNMANVIRFSVDPTCQVLSGLRGGGKTTELNLLNRDLSNGTPDTPGYFVVHCEADNYVDLNDVDYTDVLLALVQQLSIAASENNIKVGPGNWGSFWDGLRGILTAPVELKKLGVKAGFLSFDFGIKENVDNRQKVRNHLRSRATSFLEAVNAVITDFQNLLKDQFEDVVVIMDNLDRIVRSQVPRTDRTNYDALFVDGGEFLRNVACHVIYTVPSALIYSLGGNNLANILGAPNWLPSVPPTTRADEVNQQGLACLQTMVHRRLEKSPGAPNLQPEHVIEPDALTRLCAASGGYVRGLMTLMQQSLTKAHAFPITLATVDQVIRDGRDQRVRTIEKPDHWKILRDVAVKKSTDKTEDYLKLLDSGMVLEYRDGDGPWYNAHPLVREAREFKE